MIYIKALFQNESGQGLSEYVLLVGFIAIAVMGVVAATGTALVAYWEKIKNKIGQSV